MHPSADAWLPLSILGRGIGQKGCATFLGVPPHRSPKSAARNPKRNPVRAQNVEVPSDLRDQQDLFGGGGSAAAAGGVFGLQLKDGSDEEGGFGDEDDEALGAEEGEV